jgi:hypothetical protein
MSRRNAAAGPVGPGPALSTRPLNREHTRSMHPCKDPDAGEPAAADLVRQLAAGADLGVRQVLDDAAEEIDRGGRDVIAATKLPPEWERWLDRAGANLDPERRRLARAILVRAARRARQLVTRSAEVRRA